MTTSPSSVIAAEGRRAPIEGVSGMARRFRVEFLVVASVALGAAGQLILKASLLLLSAHRVNGGGFGQDPRVECATGIVFGLGIYAVGTWFWVKAVSRASISYLYPLSAGSYALVALGGRLLFGEVIHPWRWAGISVISAGVALLAAGGERGAR